MILKNLVLTFFYKLSKNQIVLESIKTLMLRLFGIGSLFAFTIFITNNYPINIVGQYDFIRTYLLVFGCIAMLGTDQSILYFVGYLKSKNNVNRMKSIYKQMVLIIFMCSAVLVFMFFIIGEKQITLVFNDNEIYCILIKANLVIFFYAITLFNTEVLRALNNIYLAELFRNTFKYATVIIGSLFLSICHQEKFLVDVFLAGFILLSIISTIVVFHKFKNLKSDHHDDNILEYSVSIVNILQKSYPIAISSTALFLLTSFDVFFLKTHFGNELVAKYSVGVKMMIIIAMVVQMINVNTATKISELYASKNFDDLQVLLRNAARIVTALTIPVVLTVCFLSEFLLKIFGTTFQDAKSSMIILVLSQGFVALFGVSAMYLNMTQRQKVFQYLLIFAAVLNYFLNYLLTPKLGMDGAAISFAITMLFWNFFVAGFVFKYDKIKIFIH